MRKALQAWMGMGVAALVLILVAQRRAELDLWQAWQTAEYSHGIAVVLIAFLLAAQRLKESVPVARPSWLGLPFLLIGGGLQLVAHLAAFDTAAEYGLILQLVGLSLSFLGRAATAAMVPAFVYLLFAIPLPHLFQANLSQDLQLLSSTLGVGVLDIVGIPVFQEGNIIDLGGYKLQVVEACNGLRYLFPLMSFGYLVALLLQAPFWKRAVLFMSTIPIAIGLNALRIAVIGFTVDQWGQGMAEGFIHDFEGWGVFILCLALLFAETWLLQKIGAPSRFRYDYLTWPKGALIGNVSPQPVPAAAACLVAALLVVAFGTNRLEHLPEIHPQHESFAAFPLSIGAWNGQQGYLSPEILDALKLSDYWLADYRAETTAPTVNLYIAYYASQRIGTTTHSPSNCVPGGGWQIASTAIKQVALSSGATLNVTELLIRRADAAQLVYYWFDERGRNLTETTMAKWYLLHDSITMHRTDGALIRLVTPVAIGEAQPAAEARIGAFLNDIYPELKRFVPE